MSLINKRLDNNILEKAEQEIESKLLPDVQADYMKIVVAGMRVAADKGANGILSGLKSRKDPVGDCALGAVNLVSILNRQSQGRMPVKAMIPAAYTLMLQALDLVEKADIAKVGVNELDHASHIFVNHLFKIIGITPAMLQHMGAKVHEVMQNPSQMDMIARRAGVVKHPQASTLTPVPGGDDGV